MHLTAMRAGELFFQLYWKEGMRRILDVGSFDFNGSLRAVAPPHSDYLGIDMQGGPGVDLVVQDPYAWPLPDNEFDAVVSTSCYEHDEMYWLTFLESLRVLRPGGFIYINAPASGVYHAFPGDCWRFYPDAGRALEKWARRNSHDVSLIESFHLNRQMESFQDYTMVFRLGPGPEPTDLIHRNLDGAVNIRIGSRGDLQNHLAQIN